MNNAHICSGHPISNCGPTSSSLPSLRPYFLLTLVLTLKTISAPSLLSHPISLHIKLWSSEWPIVTCCCSVIYLDILNFFSALDTPNIRPTFTRERIDTSLRPLSHSFFFLFYFLFCLFVVFLRSFVDFNCRIV